MRSKKVKRIRNKPIINLTPIIDMVFIMLIFFAVNISLDNSLMDLSLPNASNKTDSISNDHYIIVTNENNIYINNNKIEQNELLEEIKKLNSNGSSTKIIIKADKNSSYGVVVEIIDNAKTAGFTQFAIATESD